MTGNCEHFRNSTAFAHRLSIYMPNIFLTSKNPQKLILDINTHVALFRDMLIHVGQAKDNPELREKIRKYRHICVEECKNAVQVIKALVTSAIADCTLADISPHQLLLFYLLQLFSKELIKCYRLIQIIPMDMSKHYENHTRPTNLGNVIGQILLCHQITPDFKQEELCSIANDIQDIDLLLVEMQANMPQAVGVCENHRNSMPYLQCDPSAFGKRSSLLCCVSRPKYM